MSLKVAIQGIPGSFHHQVALLEFGENCEIIPFSTFEPVAKAVAEEVADVAVMAIENSIAGAILPNYDLIDRYELHIWDEFYLPISHQLMALPGQEIQALTEVRSHPMALLQCKQFLGQFPKLAQKDDIDTATVAKRIQDEKLSGTAAIASKIAADIYGLEILAEDIQTVKNNFTRFIILRKSPKRSEEANKASLKITIKNESGGLAKLLTMLADFGLNLSKIQSIPVMEKPWEYSFFIDAVFENREQYKSAMEQVKSDFGDLKIFGEYKSRKP
ncbi:prephenate dehydratase [Algoriphagus hitonicola]|uniref:prephenate dehydratase n=2 Tax=Algoriphagus hitonicola TaxID=435880 RepID=A0A1I2TNP1_9BACT|nr:prephenate dehydratase [Algoriphagus hitonicola]SFG65779.1 prephenate dehydratase [Algoriphagus hitonicola]